MDGEPVDFTFAAGGLVGPEGLAAREAEHGALSAAGRRQLVPGLGEGALSQGDVLWTAWHGLLNDSVEETCTKNQSDGGLNLKFKLSINKKKITYQKYFVVEQLNLSDYKYFKTRAHCLLKKYFFLNTEI